MTSEKIITIIKKPVYDSLHISYLGRNVLKIFITGGVSGLAPVSIMSEKAIGYYVRMTQEMYNFVQSKISEGYSGPDYVRGLIAKEMGDPEVAEYKIKRKSSKKKAADPVKTETVVQEDQPKEEPAEDDEFPFE